MRRQMAPFMLLLALVATVVAGCSGGSGVNPLIPTPTSLAGSPAALSSPVQARQPCQDGVFQIGDLPAIDPVWLGQLDTFDKEAIAWHDDAELVQLRVSCALFGPGFRLQPSYYSAQAQAMFAADTRESHPVNLDPGRVEPLPLESVSFQRVHGALIEADFTDDLTLDPSTGVDVRISSQQAPFGPADVPAGALIAHVSVEQAGLIKDLFVDEQTGNIYTYQSPA